MTKHQALLGPGWTINGKGNPAVTPNRLSLVPQIQVFPVNVMLLWLYYVESTCKATSPQRKLRDNQRCVHPHNESVSAFAVG